MTGADTSVSTWSVRWVSAADPRAVPLFEELQVEYSTRYPEFEYAELTTTPAEVFSPPDGGFVILVENGETIAGGAFRRYDTETAELKRIWTSSGHRGRGLGRRVVGELEREAAVRGYRRVYLTTGPRQPEARALYLNTGYTALFDEAADPETIGPLPFEKLLPVAEQKRTSS